MEKYVIDLDKVLDELELRDNDEASGQYEQSNYQPSNNAPLSNNRLQNFYKLPASSIVNSYDKIDINDADFSIQTKPPKILNSIVPILDSPSYLQAQRIGVHTSTGTCRPNVIAKEEAPIVNLNHFIAESVVPLSQPTNEPDASTTTLIGGVDGDDQPTKVAATDEISPPQSVNLPETEVNINLPAHCLNNGGGGEEASNDNASQFSLSVIDDKLQDEMIITNSSDLNSNVTFNGATNCSKETDENAHFINDIDCESKSEELIHINLSNCDNAINEEERDSASSMDVIQPHTEKVDELSNVSREQNEGVIDSIEASSVPLELSPVHVEVTVNCQAHANEEEMNHVKDFVEEVVVDAEETIIETVAESADIGAINQLDINNMSEEELDKFLSDLVSPHDEENETEIENSSPGDLVNEDASSTVSQIVSSQMAECESVVADKELKSADGHRETSKVFTEEAIGNAASTDRDIVMDVDVPVECIDSQDISKTINSIPTAEASAIICEQSDHLVEQAEESKVEDSTLPSPDSSRPRSLTLQDEAGKLVVEERVIEDASQSQEQAQLQPSTSGSEANRGGLVQNIAYFERQEMPNGLTEEEQMLGKVKPFWIPDEECQNCLHCDSKFTLIKRRHHCRSCGKVLCSHCCNYKAKLMYLENKEARVCQLCFAVLMRIEEVEKANGHPIDISEMEQTGSSSSNNPLTISFPDPNNPAEYCSTISPFDQVAEAQNRAPPTVMVPVGVLKRPGSSTVRRGGNSSESSLQDRPDALGPVKQVIFSDGVRPGGDLVESPSTSRLPEERPIGRTQLQLKSPSVEKPLLSVEQVATKRVKPSRVVVADKNATNLPPIVNYNELKAIDGTLPSKPTYIQLLHCLRASHLPAITFGLTKNLYVNAKLISKLCCNSVECWSFSSRGLASVGQDEVFFCLDCISLKTMTVPDEENDNDTPPTAELVDFPRDVFRLFTAIYDSASKGSLYTELSHIFFPDGVFGNKENSGFIFTRPSLQCFQSVLLPAPPNLIALLIHKWEIPWAKVFPLRLALRLGHEYSTYPTPVISYANRKPVYFEIGHTIMNVLADFRNFQYTLSVVNDLVIHVEDKKRVSLQIPRLSYEKVCKVLSTCNEHVLAFGGNFSVKADSHFVCVQNEQDDDIQGQYHTQVAHLEGSPLKVTAANFIVFSGALKSSTGLKAKMNIVEDGLLVQIPPTTMEELRTALRELKDFQIDCCKVGESESTTEEWVRVNWLNDERTSANLGVRSQIDGLNLEGVQSVRILSGPDYANERYLIRWIEVFILQINENGRRYEMVNTSRLAESVSQAFCVALSGFLHPLYDSGLTKIGLRVSLDVDKVGYEAGSAGEQLPPQYTGQLDSALIPAIMENISTTGIEDPLVIELLFYILLK